SILRLCCRAPLILMTRAGMLSRNVQPSSYPQPYFFSSYIASLPAPRRTSLGRTTRTEDYTLDLRRAYASLFGIAFTPLVTKCLVNRFDLYYEAVSHIFILLFD